MLKELREFIKSIEEELGDNIKITFSTWIDDGLCMRVSQLYKDTIVNCEHIYTKEELNDIYDEENITYFKRVIVKRMLSEKAKYDQESDKTEGK